MCEQWEMDVYNQPDVTTVRSRVRYLAQDQGFGITEQVGVAVATWSLAQALRLGEMHAGHVRIECLTDHGSRGLRITCSAANSFTRDLAPEMFGSIRWMVDDLTVEKEGAGRVQVTLIKWVTPGDSHKA